MRISDWSSDVCSSDLDRARVRARLAAALVQLDEASVSTIHGFCQRALREFGFIAGSIGDDSVIDDPREAWVEVAADLWRSANTGGEEGARHLRTLWKTPDELAGDLRDICDPAPQLLPAADASRLPASMHATRDEPRPRFHATHARPPPP